MTKLMRMLIEIRNGLPDSEFYLYCFLQKKVMGDDMEVRDMLRIVRVKNTDPLVFPKSHRYVVAHLDMYAKNLQLNYRYMDNGKPGYVYAMIAYEGHEGPAAIRDIVKFLEQDGIPVADDEGKERHEPA